MCSRLPVSNSKHSSFTNKLDFSEVVESSWDATLTEKLSKDNLNNETDYNNGKILRILWFWTL